MRRMNYYKDIKSSEFFYKLKEISIQNQGRIALWNLQINEPSLRTWRAAIPIQTTKNSKYDPKKVFQCIPELAKNQRKYSEI